MDRQELTQRLMETFVVELDEHVRSLNGVLLAVEQGGGRVAPDQWAEVQRAVHSLKGAARAVDVRIVEAACHRVEDILVTIRIGDRPLDAAVVDLLFGLADGLVEVGARLRHGQGAALPGSRLEALLPALDATREKGAAASHQPVRAPSPDPSPPPMSEGYVRVPARKLDVLLNRSAELLVASRRLGRRRHDADAVMADVQHAQREWRNLRTALLETGDAESALVTMPSALTAIESRVEKLATRLRVQEQTLDKAANLLDDEIQRLRLQPFHEACEGLDRATRDLAHAVGKEVRLVIEGGDVALDRSILQALRDPLLHLVRNAIDHGLEDPDDRQIQGKPSRGRITVRAVLKGSEVEVAVEDDGRGIGLEAVADAARRRDLTVPEETADATRLIFRPGFSTASNLSEVSGRGLGLDVVKSRIGAVGGAVDVSSRPGKGTCFLLRLPLTLTRTRVVLVRCCGGQMFAVPVAGVQTLLIHDSSPVPSVDGRPMLFVDHRPVPAATLEEMLGAGPPSTWGDSQRTLHVVLTDGEQRAALAVDELVDEQEVVVKTLGSRLRGVPGISGAAIVAEGQIALILSPAALIAAIGRSGGRFRAPKTAPYPTAGSRRVLVVDDSLTARTLERSILEAAGYEVAVAVDGTEAWRMLEERCFAVVVADLDMPGMDGLELTRAIREHDNLAALPIVIVTGRESPEDRERALQAGADAYLHKSTVDEGALLDAIARLV